MPAGGEPPLLLYYAVRAFLSWIKEALVSDLPPAILSVGPHDYPSASV